MILAFTYSTFITKKFNKKVNFLGKINQKKEKKISNHVSNYFIFYLLTINRMEIYIYIYKKNAIK
jgi:glutamyl-tRNA reductase